VFSGADWCWLSRVGLVEQNKAGRAEEGWSSRIRLVEQDEVGRAELGWSSRAEWLISAVMH
jgi:hypothetical protein